MRLIVSTALAFLFAGCWLDEINCTEQMVVGVTVTVFDASGERVCSAQVVARSGDYEETLEAFELSDEGCAYSGLHEREGTYTITATSQRFSGQLSKSVTIESGACHVISETLELRAE